MFAWEHIVSLWYKTTGWNLIKLGIEECTRSLICYKAWWPDLTRNTNKWNIVWIKFARSLQVLLFFGRSRSKADQNRSRRPYIVMRIYSKCSDLFYHICLSYLWQYWPCMYSHYAIQIVFTWILCIDNCFIYQFLFCKRDNLIYTTCNIRRSFFNMSPNLLVFTLRCPLEWTKRFFSLKRHTCIHTDKS